MRAGDMGWRSRAGIWDRQVRNREALPALPSSIRTSRHRFPNRLRVRYDAQALPSSTIEANLKAGKAIDVIERDGYSAIHVEDVVKALLLASLNRKAYGRVFNLANSVSFVSYREVYELLIRQTESKSKISLRRVPHHADRVRESTDKIRRTLGWRPQCTRVY